MDLNATSSAAPPAPFWKTGPILFALVLLLALPQAALLPLLDRDEPRFAEASREMLQSGNFIVPTFNHEPRYAKPPLIYWCQALSFELFGENAFAARLPSLLATAGATLMLYAWGVELGSPCIGMIAALGFAFCVQTMQQGRVATADALLIFFMTLTGWAGWKLLMLAKDKSNRTGQRAWHFWGTILALAFAGGFLAKGPEALLPILPLLFLARSFGMRTIAALLAIFALGLFLVSWWAIPAYIQTGGAYWKEGLGHDVRDRMVSGNFQGHGASSLGWYLLGVPLYLLTFWLSALPWSPLLLTHRKKLFASWKPDPSDTYLLLNAGLTFLVFSLMVTKLPHYTLPAFPFLALLFARRWTAAGLSPVLPTQLSGGLGILLAILAAIAIPVAMANHLTPSPVGELVREAQDSLTPTTEFALVDFREPNAVWEMRRAIHSPAYFIGQEKVIPFLQQSGPRAVVLSTALWEQLRAEAGPGWKTYEAGGWNTAKGWDSKKGSPALIDLTLVVNSDGDRQ